jgi:superfamily II DNA or RNA helicase
LQAVFSKRNFPYSNISERIKEITPYSRLSQSELFTGNPQGISLESEIRKEIASSDEICWLVSFIRYSGIRIFKKDLEEFTGSGRKLRVITTSYMGATEVKAVEFLASLPNSEVKVSYNADHERLHAKAYLFLRNSGFHTGYIGSSNISRSALTNGLEWNLKVTTKEISHVIDKFRKTFDTYWEDKEFEHYRAGSDRQKLSRALAERPGQDHGRIISFFDIKPYPYQSEVLSRLTSEREIHNRYRNLIVAATGTGKTIISAFDFKRFREQKPDAKLLFVAHRKEILQQSQSTFQQVLRDGNFGELWVDGLEPSRYDQVFASVQTLNNRIADLPLDKDFYDFIIIDEVHHIAADSYRPILSHFEPSILLGLTATPERMDGADILKDFSDTIAAEIRLPEALNRKLLCPFQYFGISDGVDISRVSWRNGKYDVAELTKLYTGEKQRVGDIINNCEKYLTDIYDVRALGFCVSQKHASYMAEQFNAAGLKAGFLTSENASGSREELRARLSKKEINYLFVVDIFNEGVDIPEIDTVLFLRPTESLTIFLQQLGRGLRLAHGKECLTVLDFVGNARPEYDFEHKFRALVGKTNTPVLKEIQDDFPHLPIGCSIILERRAKEIILENIRAATSFRRNQILQKIQNFRHQSTLPLTLKNFLEFNHMERPQLYRRGSWKRLCADAGVIPDFNEPNEKEITRFLERRLPGCNSLSYLKFVKRLILEDFSPGSLSEEEELMLAMFHYDVWQKSGAELGFVDFRESVKKAIKENPVMAAEMLEVTDYLMSEVEVVEKELDLGYPFPLRLHSRYNRDQIMAALRLHTFESASSNREGVARQQALNTEALFITLNKSEREYSPTTMYEDYALNEYLFHWQSQNSASPESPVGLSYIKHRETGKKILLFVREQNRDEYGLAMSYVFLGEASFVKSYGARPMSIEWRLAEPIPAGLLKESRKLVG